MSPDITYSPANRRHPSLLALLVFATLGLASCEPEERPKVKLDEWPADGVAISEIKKWPGYDAVPSLDPLLADPALSKSVDEMESRLRKELPGYIGDIVSLARNPERPERSIGFNFYSGVSESPRHPRLACWQIKGEHGSAFVILESTGGMKINIAPDSTHPLVDSDWKDTKQRAKELLTKIWGGAPDYAPLRWTSNNSAEWIGGVDGRVESSQTNVSVRFDTHREWDAKESKLVEAWIQTPLSYDSWKAFDLEAARKQFGRMTEREAIAAAVQQLDVRAVLNLPKTFEATQVVACKLREFSFLNGWQFIMAGSCEGKVTYLEVDIAESTRRSDGGSTSDKDSLRGVPLSLDVNEIRKWPEYSAAVKHQAEKKRSMGAMSNEMRELLEHAITAFRPDLKGYGTSASIGQESRHDEVFFASLDKRISGHNDEDLYSLFIRSHGEKPHLGGGYLVFKPSGYEPAFKNQRSWKRFASDAFEKMFGYKPTGQLEAVPILWRPEDKPRGYKMKWRLNKSGLGIDFGQCFNVNEERGGQYYYYWNSGLSPAQIAELSSKIDSGEIKLDRRAAVMTAVKASQIYAPDVAIENWQVWKCDLCASFNEAITLGESSFPVTALWRIDIRDGKFGREHLNATVDAGSGKLVDFALNVDGID